MTKESQDRKWLTFESAASFLFEKYDQDNDGRLDQFEFTLFLWDLKRFDFCFKKQTIFITKKNSFSSNPLTKSQAIKCWGVVDSRKRNCLDISDFHQALDILWDYDFSEEVLIFVFSEKQYLTFFFE